MTISRHYKGVALTYAQVANKPQLHARNTEETKTLVIFDEIHHAGDSLPGVTACVKRSMMRPAAWR